MFDDSGSGNNGELTSLASVTKTSGTCGNGLWLHGGESTADVFSTQKNADTETGSENRVVVICQSTPLTKFIF